jgi:hypothetical protein
MAVARTTKTSLLATPGDYSMCHAGDSSPVDGARCRVERVEMRICAHVGNGAHNLPMQTVPFATAGEELMGTSSAGVARRGAHALGIPEQFVIPATSKA